MSNKRRIFRKAMVRVGAGRAPEIYDHVARNLIDKKDDRVQHAQHELEHHKYDQTNMVTSQKGKDPVAGSTELPRAELLSDGDTSTLSDLATLRAESLALFKKSKPHWVTLIERRRNRLSSPFAKTVAEYLLEEKVFDPLGTSLDEKAAWKLAEAMMRNVRPGFVQRTSHAPSSASSSLEPE